MWKNTFALACLLTTSSLAVASQANETLEKIYGYTLKSDAIDFLVLSTGCTSDRNFTLLEAKSYPAQWILRRDKPDFCKAAPHIVSITLPKSAGEGVVMNPVTSKTPAISCSTPIVKPLPGTADWMYLDAAIELRYEAEICEGQGGYKLFGSASRTGGFAGFSDFEMIQSEVCVAEGQLQRARVKTEQSEAELIVTKVGPEGIQKASLTVDSGRLNGSQYHMSCEAID